MVVSEKLLDFIKGYFGTKLQRAANWVTVVGLSLIIVSYNEVIMKFVLEPAGFSINGRKPVYLGLMLIAIGLVTLLLDKLFDRTKPVTFQQDRNLLVKIRDILPWETVNSFLNNISNLYYVGEQSKSLRNLNYLYSDKAHQFENSSLKSKSDMLEKSLDCMIQYMNLNFVGPEPVGTDFFKWIIDKSVDINGKHSELYWKKLKELEALRISFEADYKDLISEGRKLGMIELQK